MTDGSLIHSIFERAIRARIKIQLEILIAHGAHDKIAPAVRQQELNKLFQTAIEHLERMNRFCRPCVESADRIDEKRLFRFAHVAFLRLVFDRCSQCCVVHISQFDEL